MTRPTGIVVVSHSARLADGVVELAAQMAPEVVLRAAGGDDTGGLGTSLSKVEEAVADVLTHAHHAVVATDLGSATMIAESAVEMLEEPERVLLADGPLVEGVVAAAVVAQGGGEGPAVRAAVEEAAGSFKPRAGGPAPGGGGTATASGPATEVAPAPGSAEGEAAVTRTLRLTNEVGLHARPAAQLARTVAGFDASVTVNEVDATSVLALMGLGLAKGDVMNLRAGGPQAEEAVRAVEQLVADRFGESTGSAGTLGG